MKNTKKFTQKAILAVFASGILVNNSLASGIPTIDVGSLTQSILSYQESLQSNMHLLQQYQNQVKQMSEQGIGISWNQILGQTKTLIDSTLNNLNTKIPEDTFQETADITNVCSFLEQNSKYFKETINKVDKKLSNKINACITTANSDAILKTIKELQEQRDKLSVETELQKRTDLEHKISMLEQAQRFLNQQANNQKSAKLLTMYDNYLEGDTSNPYSRAKFDEDLKTLANQLSRENNTKQSTALTNTMLLKLLEITQKQYELSLNIASMNANEKKASQSNTYNTESFKQDTPKVVKREELDSIKSFAENFEPAQMNEYGFPAFVTIE
ncbi:hypothetical protein [Campylobacter troglodytis]|uniref:hypothetical protein n=1 Tax=Campylobacter troglodytis TaxID=654363 RepID=UPI0011585A50|nr:hypothetical protein [Campylobacter troglodytis]TQR56256.1 hypothetical protein DMC01_09230 [Campylobacter troglodytis]